jgi:hypothetical protein
VCGVCVCVCVYIIFQGRMAEESMCKMCGNHKCADYKEEEENSKKLASLLDPMRTRIYRHEEVIR